MSQLKIVDLDFINSESCSTSVKGGAQLKNALNPSIATALDTALVTKLEAKLSNGKYAYTAAGATAGAAAGATRTDGKKASASVEVSARV